MKITRGQIRQLMETILTEGSKVVKPESTINLPSSGKIFGDKYILQGFENGGKLILKRTRLSGEKWSITSMDDFEISSLGTSLKKWKNNAHGVIDYPHFRSDGETIPSQGHSSVLEIKTTKPEQEIRIQTSGGL